MRDAAAVATTTDASLALRKASDIKEAHAYQIGLDSADSKEHAVILTRAVPIALRSKVANVNNTLVLGGIPCIELHCCSRSSF